MEILIKLWKLMSFILSWSATICAQQNIDNNCFEKMRRNRVWTCICLINFQINEFNFEIYQFGKWFKKNPHVFVYNFPYDDNNTKKKSIIVILVYMRPMWTQRNNVRSNQSCKQIGPRSGKLIMLCDIAFCFH